MNALLGTSFDLSTLLGEAEFDRLQREIERELASPILVVRKPVAPVQTSMLPKLSEREACKAQSVAIAAALAHLERGRVMEAQVVLHGAEEACAETMADIAEAGE